MTHAERILTWAETHPRAAGMLDAADRILGRPITNALQRATERLALRAQIRACGGESPPESDDVDALRWRLRRLTLVGNDKPGVERATARLATWFAIDEGTASRILVAVRDDEERAVRVLLCADEAGDGLVAALRDVDMWAATVGARRLLLAWHIAAGAPPEMRLFWAKRLDAIAARAMW